MLRSAYKTDSFHVLPTTEREGKQLTLAYGLVYFKEITYPELGKTCPCSLLSQKSAVGWKWRGLRSSCCSRNSLQNNNFALLPFVHTRRHLRYSKSKAERFLPLACVIFLFPSRLAIGVEVVQVAPRQPWQKSLINAAVEGKAGRLHQRLQTPLPTHSCRAGTLVLPDNVSAFTILMHLVPGRGVHTAYSIHIK